MKAFVSWSGGKESSLSCHRAMRSRALKVECLLNMLTEDGERSRSHGLSAKLLRLQAEAMGISLVQRKTTWQNYEKEFKKALSDFKTKGIERGIFGDIDVQEHRDWVERVCKDMRISPILPLWKEEREVLLEEFIQAGFKAIIVRVNADFLSEEWLGRIIDSEFVKDLKALGGIDLSGEKGEYHTFVYEGPIFKKKVNFVTGRKILRGKHWSLEMSHK